MGAEFLY